MPVSLIVGSSIGFLFLTSNLLSNSLKEKYLFVEWDLVQHTLFFLSFAFFPFFPRMSTNPGTFPDLKCWRFASRGGSSMSVILRLHVCLLFSKKPQMLSRQSKLQENHSLPKCLWNQQGSRPRWLSHVSYGTPVSWAQKPRLAPSARGAGGDLHNAGTEIFTNNWTGHIYWLLSCPPHPPLQCDI